MAFFGPPPNPLSDERYSAADMYAVFCEIERAPATIERLGELQLEHPAALPLYLHYLLRNCYINYDFGAKTYMLEMYTVIWAGGAWVKCAIDRDSAAAAMRRIVNNIHNHSSVIRTGDDEE